MKKKLIPLLVLTIVLMSAPAAMATHCDKCKLVHGVLECVPATLGGWEVCIIFGDTCHVETLCTHASAPEPDEPLAAAFTVASVERLDEPNAATETLVASLETPERTDSK